jgi:hypothetical protein
MHSSPTPTIIHEDTLMEHHNSQWKEKTLDVKEKNRKIETYCGNASRNQV